MMRLGLHRARRAVRVGLSTALLAQGVTGFPDAARGAAVRLVGDLRPGDVVSPSLASAWGLDDGRVLVEAEVDDSKGVEPAVVTPAGDVQLLGDFCPGECSSIPYYYSWLYEVGSWRAMRLADEAGDFRTFLTRGDVATTHELTGFVQASNCNYALGEVPGALLYARFQADTGCEPWAWDLTTHQWRLLFDARPGPDSSYPWVLGVGVSNRIVALLGTSSTGKSLHLLGADAASSVELAAQLPASSSYGRLVRSGAVWFFTAPGQVSTRGALWTTDGTAAGTRRVIDDATIDEPTPLASLGASKLIVGGTIDDRQQVLVWNGATFTQLTQFSSSSAFAQPFRFASVATVGERAVAFLADDGVHGTELWWTDGTKPGTRLSRDLCPGSCSSQPTPPQTIGSRVVWIATSPQKGREVWTSAPGKAPALLLDHCPGRCSGSPDDLEVVAGAGSFDTSDILHGDQVWLTNGAPRSARVLEGFEFASPFAAGGERYLIGARVDGFNRLLRSTGWPPQIEELPLPDAATPLSSAPGEFFPAGNGVYFAARESGRGREPWYADGTGAVRLGEVAFGHAGLDASFGDLGRAAIDSGLLFTYRGDAHFARRSGGISKLIDECPVEGAVARGSRAFFECDGELAVTDGTLAGTLKLLRLASSGVSDDGVGQPWGSSELAFLGRADSGEVGVYLSNGTVAGTRRLPMVVDYLGPLVTSAGKVFLVAGFDRRLQVSDGNVASPITELEWPNGRGLVKVFAHPRGFGLFNDADEFWSTDGTPNGWIHHGRWKDESSYYSDPQVVVLANTLWLYDRYGPDREGISFFDAVDGVFEPLQVEGTPRAKVQRSASRLFFLTEEGLTRRLYRTNAAGDGVEELYSGMIYDFAPTADGKHVYLSLVGSEVGQELFVWDE